MNEPSREGTAFGISIGLAFIGGYADASSFLLARTFTGHLTGNCILAAVSAASCEWSLTLERFLAVAAFVAGILLSLILGRFVSIRLSQYSLAIAMLIEVHVQLAIVRGSEPAQHVSYGSDVSILDSVPVAEKPDDAGRSRGFRGS